MYQDDSAFHGQWRLGKVSEVYPAINGVVRIVECAAIPVRDGGPVFGGQITRQANEVVVLLPVDWLRGEIIQCEVRTVQNDDVLEI